MVRFLEPAFTFQMKTFEYASQRLFTWVAEQSTVILKICLQISPLKKMSTLWGVGLPLHFWMVEISGYLINNISLIFVYLSSYCYGWMLLIIEAIFLWLVIFTDWFWNVFFTKLKDILIQLNHSGYFCCIFIVCYVYICHFCKIFPAFILCNHGKKLFSLWYHVRHLGSQIHSSEIIYLK